MIRLTLLFLLTALTGGALSAQQSLAPLTVEKIMQDPKWIGTSPQNVFWSPDNKRIYFDWNPDKADSDSLYYYSVTDKTIVKSGADTRKIALSQNRGDYNNSRSELVYSQQGNIYLLDLPTARVRQITGTEMPAHDPVFSFGEKRIVYIQGDDLFSWNRDSGTVLQLTDFTLTKPGTNVTEPDPQQAFLTRDALGNSAVLRERQDRKNLRDSLEKKDEQDKNPKLIYTDGREVGQQTISPDGRFISYRLEQAATGMKNSMVPEYVTVSGYTEELRGRTKVGAPYASYSYWMDDLNRDTIYPIITKDIPGIRDLPDYLADYPVEDSLMRKNPPVRKVALMGPYWNEPATRAVVVVRSLDNKDRWIMALDPETGRLSLLDRQRDEAWVDGPGIGWNFSPGNIGWVNDSTCWFQSEATGYSQLYLENVETRHKQALTSGNYEVKEAQLSRDKKYFYLTTNQVHPGETQLYKLEISSGHLQRLTQMEGGNESMLSPDNRLIAFRHSFSNHPWELYLQENRPGAVATRITDKAESPLFRSYPWRAPRIITFADRDGAWVYARLFRPQKQAATRPGVIFIHGAGYLQDAHKYWSDDYFREYFFENLLTDEGYTVMDIDYRGSAGYGRDWRTAIYRHMGGKDLDDIVDGAKYMSDSLSVDPTRIGIWGGSYGGFLTLMGLFTHPGIFACGAALRSVTDWAHYNHEYTADILNEPFTDSLAYVRSSPIYFAAGLKDHLLMCHGMQDTNVNFQDIIRLTEKLIELGKHHWELAVYPLENHGFTDASSWTDEYSRIHQLFEDYLSPPVSH